MHAHGFVRTATSTPRVRTADVTYNTAGIIEEAVRAHEAHVDLLVYPELSVSSYLLDDLVMQGTLIEASTRALNAIATATASLSPICVVGAPLLHNGQLFNCAVIIAAGRIAGVVPKSFLPNYREFYEKRWFAHGRNMRGATIAIGGEQVPFGTDLIFASVRDARFRLFVEICEDMWAPTPPSNRGALAGATVVANLSASNIVIGKADERHLLVRSQSSRLACAYVYSAAGHGESTTDHAWDGQGMVYEMGELLAESERFAMRPELCVADIDLERIEGARIRNKTFDDAVEHASHDSGTPDQAFRFVPLEHNPHTGDIGLARKIDRFPFVPDRQEKLAADCFEAFNIQVDGLMRRMEATGTRSLIIGISGGLDSTHALIVAIKACDRLGRARSTIRGYTLPGFGTSEQTKANAWALMEAFGITAEEIDIKPIAQRMLEDIGHRAAHPKQADGADIHDTTFENVQAGLRSDLLFRLAGQHSGFVIGTGDLSELALGWCTYGVGDQMSHYAVNAGVPKTLIQHLIRWTVQTDQFAHDADTVLEAVLATEISPELVPQGIDGTIQSTEEKIGPYELNDFFLHHVMRWGLKPSKVAFLALHAWRDAQRGAWPPGFPAGGRNAYDLATVRKWLESFLVRFFQFSQFKRSALPNGPKVSSGGALSPRGDWRAPSDAVADLWLAELCTNVPE